MKINKKTRLRPTITDLARFSGNVYESGGQEFESLRVHHYGNLGSLSD
jgi:hypothetical protein